ncbi:hypothetical protein AVEN_141340-1 [Araneus ventricosus]|uniref:Uncharacterized protein n=1 Tax=Araneus ventricosus TaxID=182803 RepID=A0A4Y2IWY3_ARAVE|nr:hypothetical protein AVEN_141340-1 [Araneus ventricosus]
MMDVATMKEKKSKQENEESKIRCIFKSQSKTSSQTVISEQEGENGKMRCIVKSESKSASQAVVSKQEDGKNKVRRCIVKSESKSASQTIVSKQEDGKNKKPKAKKVKIDGENSSKDEQPKVKKLKNGSELKNLAKGSVTHLDKIPSTKEAVQMENETANHGTAVARIEASEAAATEEIQQLSE